MNFNWSTGTPDPAVPADQFSVRWSGWVQAPTSGQFNFFVTADDGLRLWIDGVLIIDFWIDQGFIERSGSARLQADHKHDIRLEYYENAGAAACKLEWSGPGVSRAIIPATRLYPRDVNTVHLDASYPKWLAGGWAVLSIPNYEEVYRIQSTEDDARANFTVSATATRLTLSGENLRNTFNNHVRSTTAFGQSEPLDWATRPLSGFVQGHLIDLADYEPDLPVGRWLALSGLVLADVPANTKALNRLKKDDPLAAIRLARDRKTADLEFEDFSRLTVEVAPAAEIVRIQHNDSSNGRTQLLLESDLTHTYLPSTVRLNANLAPASAGDSKQMRIQPEPLGSGDGSRSLQRFALRQGPLTYITAPTPSGTASTLDIRVDGLLWQEAPRFTAPGPTERAYTVKLDENGSATVQFGDGAHGTRLPTGSGNVEARYRVGLGTAGNVKAEQISMLLTRPPGLKAVSNPVAASGGTDAEAGDEARRNAPLRVRTLDRIVSLRDFEDFAAAFTGIGKAQAVWLWDGERRMVHLSVAGTDGAPLDPNGALYRNLLAAIDSARPPHQPLRVSPCHDLCFGLTAGLWVAPDYEAEKVLAAAGQALESAFGFAARAFGQPVTGSEVLAALQGVAGVIGADLDRLVQVEAGLTVRTSSGPDGSIPARGRTANCSQPTCCCSIPPRSPSRSARHETRRRHPVRSTSRLLPRARRRTERPAARPARRHCPPGSAR